MRWPRRRRARAQRRGAPRLRVSLKVPVPPPPAEPVRLVPKRRRDALVASVVAAGVLAVLVALFVRTVRHWEAVDVPGRVALVAIGAGTVFAMAVYLVSLLGFLLPRLVGLRPAVPPRGEANTNDSL